jgi:hypothetical protein
MVNVGLNTADNVFVAMDEAEQKYVKKAITTNRILFSGLGVLAGLLIMLGISKWKARKNNGGF